MQCLAHPSDRLSSGIRRRRHWHACTSQVTQNRLLLDEPAEAVDGGRMNDLRIANDCQGYPAQSLRRPGNLTEQWLNSSPGDGAQQARQDITEHRWKRPGNFSIGGSGSRRLPLVRSKVAANQCAAQFSRLNRLGLLQESIRFLPGAFVTGLLGQFAVVMCQLGRRYRV